MTLPTITFNDKRFLVGDFDRRIATLFTEVETKKIGSRTHDRGDFLVVEDPEKVTTWHLPVKVNGTPNRRLAAAAWAALFSAKGFRGSKYEGPNVTGAKRKLRALYKAEDWDEPPISEVSEMYDEPEMTYVPYGVQSFDDLDAAEAADEASRKVYKLTYQFQRLVSNVLSSDVPSKTVAIQALADDFVARIGEALGEDMTQGMEEVQIEGTAIELSESATGHALRLSENENGVNRRGPLDLDIVIIKPGFGNKRDNHYYGSAMLEANAEVFVGAKMYSTDHRDSEKSVRTEVSRIKDIVDFVEGAPVGRVTVFDPDFAESVRNRSDAGELESLECSILASGVARTGEIEGQKAKIVEAITDVSSVDWVTKAGAGGHALRLSESEVETMEPEKDKELEETELEEVVIEEGQENKADKSDSTGDNEPAAETSETTDTPVLEEIADTTETTQPVPLSEADIRALIPDHLPQETQDRLLSQPYFDEQAVKQAVTIEVDYLRAVTGSGQPFGSSSPATQTITNFEEAAKQNLETHAAIRERWFGGKK
jgi:hypothetical protein